MMFTLRLYVFYDQSGNCLVHGTFWRLIQNIYFLSLKG